MRGAGRWGAEYWTFLFAEISELLWSGWSGVETHKHTHKYTHPHISCVKERSDVSAVNSDPGEAQGYSSADQTLSNTSTHISFPPSRDSQLFDKPESWWDTKKRTHDAVKWSHWFQITLFTQLGYSQFFPTFQNTIQQSPTGLLIKQWAIRAYSSSGCSVALCFPKEDISHNL